MSARRSLMILVGLALLLLTGLASADTPTAATPGSWAGQLDELASWLDAHKKATTCADHCFTLERLTLKGGVEAGSVHFELTGGVLASTAVPVPLFGPASQVRLEDVTEDGHPASIGFDDGGYYVFTGQKRFTLRGTLVLGADLALKIPGPLNTLDADLASGRVVEGAHLAGLHDTTIHFDRAKGDAASAEPTIFQLSRAIRVGREIRFEYRLVMRSGKDLGVARLPLAYGEKVLDVTGANGWRVDDHDLVLPTSGHDAEITVHGSLPAFTGDKPFTPDARSAYEWWLVESDAEHRVKTTGDAGQVDASRSPIARTEPSARLYLVQRGQHLGVSVEALTSSEVLAAVVRSEQRTVVLTESGDVVSDDTLSYENNGIDYLPFDANGRAIFLSLDGKASRILREGASEDVLVPLDTGSHTVRVQSLSRGTVGLFGGRLVVPTPKHTLTQSTSGVTIGLPRRVHPLAVVGGDHATWLVGWADAAALLVACGVAFTVLKRRALRVAGAVALGGLWFLSATAFVALLTVAAASGVLYLTARLVRGRLRAPALAGVAGVVGVASLLLLATFASTRRDAPSGIENQMQAASNEVGAMAGKPSDGRFGVRGPSAGDTDKEDGDVTRADEPKQKAVLAGATLLEGVTPVALTLPSADHFVSASRELVTKDRPFSPIVYYVTDWTILALLVPWAAAVLLLVWAHRAAFARARAAIRARLAAAPDVAAPTVAPVAGTQTT